MPSTSLRLILTLFCIFLVKILFLTYLPLVNDEAYAIAVSKDFSLSFLDHPPIGFWLSQIFNNFLEVNNPILFRLPYLLCGIGTSFFLYKIGKELGGEKTGLWSALLYNIAPFYFLSGGFLVVPDGPLNLGISLTAYSVLKIQKIPYEKQYQFLLILGISLALSFASKYQGFLIGIGCLLVLFISPKIKDILRNPFFYVCLLISLIGLLPTFIWNLNHEWISFQFHGSRQDFNINLINFSKMFIGSMIYLLPIVFLIPIKQFLKFVLNKNILQQKTSPEIFLVIMALPNIILFSFVFISSNNTFPHWIMPGWLLFLPILAKALSSTDKKNGRVFLYISIWTVWPFIIMLIIHSQTGILTNHMKNIPKWDNTLELIDWDPIREPLQKLISEEVENKEVKLAALTWTEAGQLSTMMNNKYETLVLEGNAHHFAYLNKSKRPAPTFLIKLSLGIKPDIKTILSRIKKYDASAIHIKNLILLRGPRDYATVSVYLLTQ